MEQIGTGPVQYGHEVVADAVDALCREIAQRLLIDLYLCVAVGTAILDGFHHRQRFYHTPAHAVRLNVLSQVTDFLTRPHLTEGHVVQGGNDTLHTNLSQLGKCYLILLAKPSPCSFHSLTVYIFFE